MERYLPHYIKSKPSQLHLDLATDLADMSVHRGQRRAYIAPRGSAKTTWLSKGYVLYGAVEGIEPLTLELAETSPQAKKYLDAVKEELETNAAIARDYPAAAGRGRIWQADRIRLRNGCEIVARGAGGRILGITVKDRRPTLVIVDDGNERGDAYSPTKRRRKLDWMIKDVLPAGEPGTNFVAAGTPIHREAIVCDLKRAGWETRSYKAMDRFPDRIDLWHEWERILLNLADPKREEKAKAFFLARAGEMTAGSELLWPERLTLYDLMAYRARYGEAAYKSEYTDDPGAPEGAEWPAEYFDRPGFWFDDWPDDLALKVIALDPSKGMDAKGGDYQAHGMLGLGRDGVIYVDAELRHETPEAMCQRTVLIAKTWSKTGRPVDAIVLEDNGTMGLIRVAIEAAAGGKLLRWECLTQSDPKFIRIRAVGAYLARGISNGKVSGPPAMRVRNSPGGRLLVDQWRDFPFGEHDDGPDAVATGLIRLEQIANGGR
jgi:hypothetical protein